MIRNDEKQIVLSVMWGSPKHFIVQLSPEGLFRFEGTFFINIVYDRKYLIEKDLFNC